MPGCGETRPLSDGGFNGDLNIRRRLIAITGVVQGVGFRPFVFKLAQERCLAGWVRNTSWGVEIEGGGCRGC